MQYDSPFRGSGVFHRGSAANYRRIIYVKTMEFKDVTILDKVRRKKKFIHFLIIEVLF